MNYKAVLWDVDGVVVYSPRISDTLEMYYRLPNELTSKFFTNEFTNCLINKADLKQELCSYMDFWNWNEGVEDFINVWLEESSSIDFEIIRLVKFLKERNVLCYLSTNQEIIRSNYLMTHMGLGDTFNGIYSSCEIGYLKPSHEYFNFILKDLNQYNIMNSSDIILIDDSLKNVKAATEFGFSSYLYKQDYLSLFNELTKNETSK